MLDILRKLHRLLSPEERRHFLLLQLAAILLAFCEMVSIGLIAPYLGLLIQRDKLQAGGRLQQLYEACGSPPVESFLTAAGLVVLTFYLFSTAAIIIVNWLIFRFSLAQGARIGNRLFRAYLSRDLLFHTAHNSSELTRTIFQDVARLTDSILTPVLMLTGRGFSALAILGLLTWVDWRVTLCAILVFGSAYGGIFVSIRRLLSRIGERFTRFNNLRFRTVNEALTGIKDCKIYQVEPTFAQSYEDATREDARNQTHRRVLLFVPRYFIEAIAVAALLLFALLSFRQGSGAEVISTLALFAIAATKLLPALQQIYSNFSLIRSDRNALDLVLSDLDLAGPPQALVTSDSAPFQFAQALEIKQLQFRYPGAERETLSLPSLLLKARSMTGFAGPSGSGKSTLIDILLGLLPAPAGSLIIDGKALDADSLRQWQSLLGYVPQSIHLIDGTLAENIAFGLAPAQIDRDQVRKVLQIVQLQDFVDSQLPQGIDSPIGERGVRLSGGQRQRIGIARALYRRPQVLIFDEATSALDGPTESAIIDAVNALSGQLTIIMIAHRLTTLRNCDTIHVLDQGSIKASGTYAELCTSHELFRQDTP